MAEHPAIEVAAGLVFREGRLLITQRREGDHLGGLWEFPGGKRAVEETFEECVRRELMEELGIEVEVGELLETIQYQYPEKKVALKFYRCRWRRNEPSALGCQAFTWIGKEELSQYAFPPADANLLQRLRTDHQLWT